MAITVEWDEETKSIIRWTFPKQWTWDDYIAAQKESNAKLAGVNHKVDVIGDLTGSAGLPPSALSVYQRTLREVSPNIGVIVLVQGNVFVKKMIQVFKKVFPHKVPGTDFIFADSIEEARALLAERQATR